MANDVTAQIRMPKSLRLQAEKLSQADRRSFSDWVRLLIEREVKAAEEASSRGILGGSPEHIRQLMPKLKK